MSLLESQQQLQGTAQRFLYSGKLLLAVAIAFVVSVLLMVGDYAFQESLGWAGSLLAIASVVIYLGVIITIAVVDGRGFLTVNGLLKWRSMRGQKRFFVGCLFVGLNAIFLGIYLGQWYLRYRRYWQLEPERRRRKIAEQEAALGMMPQTDGNCQRCQQPLQLGAEFCAYCGERVTQRPRICPKCYTTTLPDARWCPACGAQLDAIVLSPVK